MLGQFFWIILVSYFPPPAMQALRKHKHMQIISEVIEDIKSKKKKKIFYTVYNVYVMISILISNLFPPLPVTSYS